MSFSARNREQNSAQTQGRRIDALKSASGPVTTANAQTVISGISKGKRTLDCGVVRNHEPSFQLTDAVDPELGLVFFNHLQTLESELMDSQDANLQLTQTVERLRRKLASAPPRKPTPGSLPTSVGNTCRSSEQQCASRAAVCCRC